MEIYGHQQYHRRVGISLCSSTEVIYVDGEFQYFSKMDESSFVKKKAGFIYNNRTKEIRKLSSSRKRNYKDQIEDGDIYIENVVRSIEKIYNEVIQRKQAITSIKEFAAVARFFELQLNQICEQSKIQLEQLFVVIIIPNDWALKHDIIDLIMVPLLQKANIVFPEKLAERVLFMTKLEALLSNVQLSPDFKNNVPSFIQNENRCVQLDIFCENNVMKIRSTYFQLKEDYNLKTFNERYFVPKIINIDNVHDFSNINFKSIKGALKQMIFKNLLKANYLIDNTLQERHPQYKNAVIDIMKQVLDNTLEYVKNDGSCDNIYYNPSFFEQFLNVDQLKKLETPDFFKALAKALVNELSTIIEIVKKEIDDIPFIRKSVICNGCFDHDLPWFQERLFRIVFHRLRKDYTTMEKSFWHFVKRAGNEDDCNKIMSGALFATSRRAMILNIILPPVLLINPKKRENDVPPENIVYIDVSLNLTTTICSSGNKEIRLDCTSAQKKLHSFKQYLESFHINTNDLIHTISLFSKDNNAENQKSASTALGKLKQKKLKPTSGNKGPPLSSDVAYFRTRFSDYLDEIFHFVTLNLQKRDSKIKNVGYVLSVEKLIMNGLCIKSQDELSEFISSEKISSLSSSKVVFADQGEKTVWNMLQNEKIEPQSYYVHGNLAEDCIYLKLNKIVEISDPSTPKKFYSRVIHIQDQLIHVQNIYEQVSKDLWCHIYSCTDEERREFTYFQNGTTTLPNSSMFFKTFHTNIVDILKERVTGNIKDNNDLKYKIELSSNHGIYISFQQIFEIAIIPFVQNQMSIVVSTLVDENIFGHYDIANLLVTGGLLKTKEYNSAYHYMVTSEIKKELKKLILEYTYRTKLTLRIDTHQDMHSNTSNTSRNTSKIPFCYHIFSEGNLRIVSSTSYSFTGEIKVPHNKHRSPKFGITGASMEHNDGGHSLIRRGDSLTEKRFKVIVPISDDYLYNRFSLDIRRHFGSYNDENIQEIISHGSDKKMEVYSLLSQKYEFYPTIIIIIHLEPLYYSSCMKITSEIYYNNRGKMSLHTRPHIFGERWTLMYS